MRGRRALALGVVLVLASRAAADTGSGSGAPAELDTSNLHLSTASTVTTDGGTSLRLPPGYFLDETKHGQVDAEFKRLQDQETRLTAANGSLLKSASGFTPGWMTAVAAFVVGGAVGAYLEHRL